MSTPFATTADLADRWPSYSADQEIYAMTLLADASAMIRERWRDVDARIASGALMSDSLVRIVCGMVKRAMINTDSEGLQSHSETAGTLSEQRTFTNPDGNLYPTSSDVRVLDSRPTRRAFAVDLSSADR